jgi:hypothetical protein
MVQQDNKVMFLKSGGCAGLRSVRERDLTGPIDGLYTLRDDKA